MQTIYKYLIKPSPQVQEIKMKDGARVLSVGIDGDNNPAIWAQVDTDRSDVKRKFFCLGTGWDISAIFKYLKIEFHGTIVDKDGLVWHVYGVEYEQREY